MTWIQFNVIVTGKRYSTCRVRPVFFFVFARYLLITAELVSQGFIVRRGIYYPRNVCQCTTHPHVVNVYQYKCILGKK